MRQQGATLLQMMLALAMAALLTQLGMPSYAAFSEDLHRAAAARDLMQALRNARSHATLQQQPVRVQPINEDWGQGWRLLLADNGQLLREYPLRRGLKIVGNFDGEVRFSAQGIPMRGNALLGGRLEICGQSLDAQRRQVILAPSGRVRLSSDAADKPLCPGS
ncbi:GspH/FimT family protein [Pseudomonas hunanensis]|nr:GspH/FimT family protein [Pseudomonas hunanensis]